MGAGKQALAQNRARPQSLGREGDRPLLRLLTAGAATG